MNGRSARHRKNLSRQKRGLRFASKIVVVLLVEVTAFTIAMIVTFWVKGDVPDTLITSFFSVVAGELLFAAMIRIFDELKLGQKKESKDDENNMG